MSHEQLTSFLSARTHELRTPVTSIDLAAQTLSRLLSHQSGSERERELATNALEVIKRQVRRLDVLLTDLPQRARTAASEDCASKRGEPHE